jgi:branched-chain amino acid transport system substrate-binding protein
MKDIKQLVVEAGHSLLPREEFDYVFYQRGVVISMFAVEGIKAAQAHFKTKVVNAEQLRWGLENLKLDEKRLKEIGMEGMVPPFSTSCGNHSGHSGAWMLQWDGAKFVKVSDRLEADQGMIEPLVLAGAKKYAESNAPWPVNEECK